jgi:hypothetical protein
VTQAFSTFSVGDGTRRLHGMSKVRRLEFITTIARAQNRRTEANLPLLIALQLLQLGVRIARARERLKVRARRLRLIGNADDLPAADHELERLCAPTVQAVLAWADKSHTHATLRALLGAGLSPKDAHLASKLVHLAEQNVLLLEHDHASPLGEPGVRQSRAARATLRH